MTTFIFSLLLLLPMITGAAESRCDNAFSALKAHQAKLAKGYNITQAERLLTKERQLRQDYQQCRQQKPPQTAGKKVGKKTTSTANKPYANSMKQTATASMRFDQPIGIKGQFRDPMMQAAWLEYYQQPKRCARPQSTPEFARCMQIKNRAAKQFEQLWLTGQYTPKKGRISVVQQP